MAATIQMPPGNQCNHPEPILMSNLVLCKVNGMRWHFNLNTIAESIDQIKGFGNFTNVRQMYPPTPTPPHGLI